MSARLATLAALAALALGACTVVKDDVVTDSAGGSVVVVDLDSARAAAAREAAAAHAVNAPTLETVVHAPPAVLPAPALPAPARASSDSVAPQPTADELRWLAASMILPVQGVKSSELHDSFTEARGGGSRSHQALDIPAPRGTPVLSATDGTLRRLFTSRDGGLMVYASDASDRFILMYAHLDRYAEGMHDGMPLKQGQTIGYVGTTGNAPPDLPHLHFAIARGNGRRWWTGVPVNPFPLLSGR